MSSENFSIRNMTEDEVKNIAVEWAAVEGWNPGIHEASCFYAADPNGFYIGLLDNEPVACISVVTYDEAYSFLGFYIVRKEYRGKGYGLRIWNTVINYHRTKNIGLDGVIAQQPNYIKSGFRFAYRNIRYEGTARQTNEHFTGIFHLSKVSFDKVVEYDTKLSPAPRDRFLKSWLNQPEGLPLVALENERVSGYSMIRKCRIGYKIGPLFAESKDIAVKLFYASNNFVPSGSLIYLDTPEVNSAAVGLAEREGMHKVFETARMYTGSFPDIDLGKVFGVTSFELG